MKENARNRPKSTFALLKEHQSPEPRLADAAGELTGDLGDLESTTGGLARRRNES